MGPVNGGLSLVKVALPTDAVPESVNGEFGICIQQIAHSVGNLTTTADQLQLLDYLESQLHGDAGTLRKALYTAVPTRTP